MVQPSFTAGRIRLGSGTENGTVTLSDARVSKPTFTADLLVAEAQDVRHEFTLTVTDDVANPRFGDVTVT